MGIDLKRRGDEARDMNRRRARDDVGRGDRRVEENGSPVCHVALFVDVMMDCGCVINLGKLADSTVNHIHNCY